LVTSKLYKEESKSLCQDILVHSMTQNGPIPLIPSLGENVVVVDDLLNCPFLTNNSAAIAIPTSLGYQLKLIDLSSLSEDLTKSIILQVFIRGNPFKGQAGLSLYAQQVYTKLISTGNLQAVVIYGSPYVADWFIERLSSKVPFIFTYGQERLAQEIALNKLFALTELKPVNKDEFTD
jgi:beta-glucosidase